MTLTRTTARPRTLFNRRRTSRAILGAAALLITSSACVGDDPIDVSEETPDESVAEAQQALDGQHRFGMIGVVDDLASKQKAGKLLSPNQNMLGDIVGIAREPGQDGMFCVWYADWEYSCGTSWDELDDEIVNTPFVAGEGMDDTANIVGMAMGGVPNFVFTWTADGVVHAGPYWDPTNITVGSFLDANDFVDGKHRVVEITGIAMDEMYRVYTYFSDGEYIEGNIVDLDATTVGTMTYVSQAGHSTGEIIDVAMMGDGQGPHRTYSWHHDVAHGLSENSLEDRVDAAATSFMRRQRIPGLSLSISKGGKVVHTKGYGYRDFGQHFPMYPDVRCGIASVSKVVTGLAVMKQHELGNIDIDNEKIFRDTGTLGNAHPEYDAQIDRNEQSHGPIVGVASFEVGGVDRIVTWYESGRVSVGTYTDPDFYNDVDPALDNYVMPADKTPSDIMAIAYSTTEGVVTYYRDGTFSRGTIDDLGAIEQPDEDNPYMFLNGNGGSGSSLDHERIVGVDENSAGDMVWWRSDGKYAIGDYLDPTSVQDWADYFFVSASELHKDHIRGIAASKVSPFTYTYGSSLATIEYVYKGAPGDLSSESEQSDGAPWYENEYEVPDYAYAKVFPGLWYNHITPYHLLTHTAGVGMYLDNGGAQKYLGILASTLTPDEAIRYSLHHKKVFTKPGTTWDYSNYGFTLLGELVAVASGTTLEQNVQGVIATPLGLSMTTCYDTPDATYDTVVHDFHDFTHEPIGTLNPTCPTSAEPWLASSGWLVSSFDLTKLMLATDQDLGHPDILDPATLDKMETPDGVYTTQALAWRTDDDAYAHGGDWASGTAYIKKYPADFYDVGQPEMTVAICANGGNANSKELSAFSSAVFEAIVSRAIVDPVVDHYNVY